LPGIESAKALDALSPEQFFVHWLEGNSGSRRVEALIAHNGLSLEEAETVRASKPYHLDHVAIGVIADGDRIARVLYHGRHLAWSAESDRWLAGYPDEERELMRELAVRGSPSVAACCRQADGSWRLLVDYEFLHWTNIAVGLKRRDTEPSRESDARAT